MTSIKNLTGKNKYILLKYNNSSCHLSLMEAPTFGEVGASGFLKVPLLRQRLISLWLRRGTEEDVSFVCEQEKTVKKFNL